MRHFPRLYNGVRLLNGIGPSLPNVHRIDKGAIPLISRMIQTGLIVDLDHFAAMDRTLTADMEKYIEDIHDLTGYYINPGSGDQVADLLFKKLKLKQARAKMTPSGDRESVEDAVLTAIQHDHPVVSIIQNYKEVEKLRGTYVRPMPELAVHTARGVWRMFPDLAHTRVPTGRLSCKDPNLLAMPTRTDRGREVRKGFIAAEGWVICSIDFCLHPDTLVKTLYGPKRITDIAVGDPVLCHKDDRITYGCVTATAAVRALPAYRLTFDNGESVIASSEHKWPTLTPRRKRGLAYLVTKTTRDLVIGERMVQCREGKSGPQRRKTWYSRSSFLYEYQHLLAAEAVLGPRPKDHDVHHIDGDFMNNDPDNLEYKLSSKHKSDHGKDNYKVQDHGYRIERLREGLRKRRTYNGSENPNSKLTEYDRRAIEELVLSDSLSASEVARLFGLSYGYSRRLVSKIERGENHRLIKKEFVGVQLMHAITVEPHHNYVLECGVVTQNSQIEVRVAAHRSKDANLISIYRNEEDIYSDFATAANKLPDQRYRDASGKWKYPTVDPMKHRRPAKICVLAAIYDVTAKGLAEQMPVVCATCNKEAVLHDCSRFRTLWTEDACQDIINAFYMRYSGLVLMRKRDHAYMRRNAYMVDMWGRLLHTQAVRSVLEWVVSEALREGSNFPMQAGAAGILKLAMAAISDYFEAHPSLWEVAEILLAIHDELLWMCRKDVAEELCLLVQHYFETLFPCFEVAIKASHGTARTWGDVPK